MLRSTAIAGSLAALGLTLSPAAGAAVRPGSVYGPATANRALAHRDALRALRALRLPQDSRRIAQAAQGTHGRLAVAPIREQPRLVDAHSFWTSDQSPGAVLSYVAHHLPRAVRLSTRTSTGSSNGVGSLSWQLPAPPGLAMRTLAVSAVALSPVLTAVRLDGEAQWLSPRPGWERVPLRVRAATMTGHGARTGRPRDAGPLSRSVVLGVDQARRLAGWIDRRPVAQPGTFRSCPFGSNQVLTVHFLDGSGRLLAQATESLASGCAALSLTVGGRPGPVLEDPGLSEELVRVQAITRCRAGDLTVLPLVRARVSGEPALTFTFRDVSPRICAAPAVTSVVLLGAHHRVLVGHDLAPPTGPSTVLFPRTAEAVTAELQTCHSRPEALSARVHLGPRAVWTVALGPGSRLRPCAQPLTLLPGGGGSGAPGLAARGPTGRTR